MWKAASLIPPTWPILSVTGLPGVALVGPGLGGAALARAPNVTAKTAKVASSSLSISMPSLFDARAVLLWELALAVRAAQLPFGVPQIVVMAVKTLQAVRAGDPEDPRHGLNPPQLVERDEPLQLDALHCFGRDFDTRLEGPTHRACRVDDHLRPHNVVALRRVQRAALDVLEDVHILVGLDARGDRPHHLFLPERIDVGVHHHHVLHEVAGSQRDQRSLLRLAVHPLVDRDVAVKASDRRGWKVNA